MGLGLLIACSGGAPDGGDGGLGPDTGTPQAAITSPAAGTVQGTVVLRASAQDDRGVAGVRFAVDGTAIGAEDTEAPYSLEWASTSVADGEHTLTAIVRDAAGNQATSAPVVVIVANAPGAPDVPANGAVMVTVVTTGDDPDADGYDVRLDAEAPRAVAANGSLHYPAAVPGAHTLTLGGLASNCTVSGDNPVAVSVTAGQTASVSFQVACTAIARQPRIVYVRTVYGGSGQLRVMNADGSDDRQVPVSGVGLIRRPTWSPDGERILFSATGPDADGWQSENIYSVAPDGSDFRVLLNSGENERDPMMSPDGDRIAFARSGNIFVMNADGSNVVQLTNDPFPQDAPAWSPDGSKLAYYSGETGGGDIYTMNADGSTQTRLTTSGVQESFPVWSPDGAWIALTYFAGVSQVHRIRPDGSDLVPVTSSGTDGSRHPSWSPDGTRLVYAFARAIAVIDADGANGTTLTTTADAEDQFPFWSR